MRRLLAIKLSGLGLLLLHLGACAFIPRTVDVTALDSRFVYPRDSFTPSHRVAFGPFEDRRPNRERLGVGRNKLMMVTTSVSLSGDLARTFERVVRQNFAANGIGEGASSIQVRGAVSEASTDAVGPDHVYVRLVASLTILDSSTNAPLLHQNLSGYQVTPVTQVSNMAWEDAFVGAMNEISEQVRVIALHTAGALAKTRATPSATPSAPGAGLSGTYTGEITGNTQGRIFTMQVTFTVVQRGNEIAGAWTTTGGTSGTMTGVLTENGIRDLRARQLNPCAGEFGGVAVLEAPNTLRGSYVGSDCNGAVTASFVVNRQ